MAAQELTAGEVAVLFNEFSFYVFKTPDKNSSIFGRTVESAQIKAKGTMSYLVLTIQGLETEFYIEGGPKPWKVKLSGGMIYIGRQVERDETVEYIFRRRTSQP